MCTSTSKDYPLTAALVNFAIWGVALVLFGVGKKGGWAIAC